MHDAPPHTHGHQLRFRDYGDGSEQAVRDGPTEMGVLSGTAFSRLRSSPPHGLDPMV